MSTEQRVVRPYLGLDGLERMFEAVRLRVSNELVEPGRSMHIASEEFLSTKIAVEFAGTEELWSITKGALPQRALEIGIGAEELDVVVIASTSFLKISDVLVRWPVAELGGLDRVVPLTVPSRPRALQAVHHGATIDVQLCLSKEIAPQPLRPHRFGTWVARAEFRLSTDFDAIGFRPLSLTPELKARMGLPPSTVRYIEVSDSLFDDVRADDAVDLWVDAEVLTRLSVSSKSSASRGFQTQLFLDAVAAIAARIRYDLRSEGSFADLGESFVGRMIMALAGNAASRADLERLFDAMITDPPRFQAYVEARSGIAKELVRMLGDDEA